VKQYHQALQHVLEHGEDREDRTGVGTKGVFGYQMRFDLRQGFPAVTTKKLAWKAVVGELLWFLEGSTDERRLAEITFEKPRDELIDKKTIWTANADAQGKSLGYTNDDFIKELGPVYGSQWRNFGSNGIDQIKNVIESLRKDPYSRRHIVSAWEASQVSSMALPPCHTLFQFHVNRNNELSCQLYQRSCDMILGLPFNIASYSLLTHIIAKICDLKVADFVWTGGDVHIYNTHVNQVRQQLERQPRNLPDLKMPNFSTLDQVLQSRVSDFVLQNYNPMSAIVAPMAV
jgi:thymidylate synthase